MASSRTEATKALRPGSLWLSRPPFLLFARVVDSVPERDGTRIRYEILDRDGCTLLEDVEGYLDSEWLRCYQPLVRRYG